MSLHISVLLNETVECLRANLGGRFLDCTFGGGGHSKAILAAHPNSTVVAIDRDLDAVQRGKEISDSRFEIKHGTFKDLDSLVEQKSFDGIVADLGMSTDQLKGDRGFSFRSTGRLDMRMNLEDEVTAEQLVNGLDEKKLYILLKQGGVGNDARRITKFIVKARPIYTTEELYSAIISGSSNRKQRESDSAQVVFQALRMAVNGEVDNITALLKFAPYLAREKGRLAVISFHSIEDTLVTKKMREWSQGCTCPPRLQCSCGKKKIGTLLTRHAVTPLESEVIANPASRSARLRFFEFN